MDVRTYTCEGCQANFTGDIDDALDSGWGTPQLGSPYCICPNCTLTDTTWFKVAVSKNQPSVEEAELLARFEKEAAEAVAKITAPARAHIQAQTQASLEHSNHVLYGTHTPQDCLGQPCTIHNRSDHPMRGWPQTWCRNEAVMERTCAHGQGHPDPDEYQLYANPNTIVPTHLDTCDGCCVWNSGEETNPDPGTEQVDTVTE